MYVYVCICLHLCVSASLYEYVRACVHVCTSVCVCLFVGVSELVWCTRDFVYVYLFVLIEVTGPL